MVAELEASPEALAMAALPEEPSPELEALLAAFGDAEDDGEEGVWADKGPLARRPAAGAAR
jgi:hypothetical protein